MRRTTVLAAAATAVALAALTACNDTENKDAAAPAPATTAATAPATTAAAPSPTATETPAPAVTTPAPVVTTPAAPAGDFDPAKAVENASKEPYAVSMKMITEVEGETAGDSTLRLNLNTVYTGRSKMKIADAVVETVITTDTVYTRMGPDEKWTKAPRPADTTIADYADYAKLLLAQGPSARKGAEIRDGVPTQHLSGHIDVAQIRKIDPSVYRNTTAKGITGFDFDQWIDAQGRTRYVEQVLVVKGSKTVNKVTFTDFGPTETFAAPAGAGAAAAG
ncbi:LppX_LprAFG lipoprotein [Kitasatospora purpeofusca]|uniref:LppX_LprAFG lipoprotein n=1 Tax=Kitasatospora purpeofusca TaxID=67352 RepID=UPI0035DA4B19